LLGVLLVLITGVVYAGYLMGTRRAPSGGNDPSLPATTSIPATSTPPEMTFGLQGFYQKDLGLHIIYARPEQAALVGMVGLAPATGAIVWQVENGTGKAAGARPGDVIIAINGQQIASEDDLRRAYGGLRRGKAKYQVRRDNQTVTLEIDCPTCDER
jgi:membrane-associated protease RseP (regulator of RpoE activity)